MLLVDGVEMLDVREAARLAGRTPETVRRWVWSGRLTARRHGNRLLIERRDLDRLVHSRTRGGQGLDLGAWARLAEEQRRTGALRSGGSGSSAADLVIADRQVREDG